MSTCPQCGQEIRFRNIGGRVVPLGCQCGSWGSAPLRSSRTERRSGEWQDSGDFTLPTVCPIKGCSPVFFIRHNGGSVWVDELGWPWPKHACFDQPDEPTYSFSAWSAKASGLTNPKLGIITSVKFTLRHSEPVLIIRLSDSTRLSLVPRWFRWTPAESAFKGLLVILSLEDNMFLHPTYGEIAFHSVTELPAASDDGWVQCARCQTWVKEENFEGHEDCCREQHDTSSRDGPERASLPHWRNHRKDSVPQPAAADQQSRARNLLLDEHINLAVERIAGKAWDASGVGADAETRLRLAKQEALRLIRMLSPHIKRQVEHHFTSQKWQPLIQRDPG